MPTAVINQTGCRVHLKSERLEVFGRNEATQTDELLREIPIRDLDRLIVDESVQITSHALAALLRGGIPVNILAWNGQFLGGFLPAHDTHGQARLRQYKRTLDAPFALQMAGRILTAKLYNQRRVLQRLNASRQPAPIPEVEEALTWLDNLFASLSRAHSLDEIRGYEGASAARYFEAWARFLPDEFPFEVRSTRPPLNPVNACISFGATLLYSEIVAFLHAHGLDPSLGLLHRTEDGRWSLALDLLEPFRPVLVEALALDLFSHQIVSQEHFEARDGGVFLNEDGRKKFYLQYERRMERQFMSESAGHRTSLRKQLEDQAVMFKAALEDPAKFEPFLMN
jgi:CRISP-associated protein Cas1